ncbi:hypothetical protein INT44_002656 [Umbelopsis vinacea]|uniref:Uncharacterized protein n=1 Tax=Umbelopsis vinacea TaxID=44442 RepID=A0A8H7U706_9FUNG|nr:hypothetical protein INT44_002656 [Umbelopsis vinacea]
MVVINIEEDNQLTCAMLLGLATKQNARASSMAYSLLPEPTRNDSAYMTDKDQQRERFESHKRETKERRLTLNTARDEPHVPYCQNRNVVPNPN